MKRKLFPAALALSLAAAFALAQGEKKSVKVSGFLIDNMCAFEHNFAQASRHETSCALMPTCAETGFAVVSEEALYRLDERGNKLALALLKATKKSKGVAVTAAGTLEGEKLHVESLEETR